MTDEQEKPAFDLSVSPSHLLHRAQQAAVNLSSETLSEQGLTLRQFAVLAALATQEGQSQSSLVEKTGIDRSTLADMVRRMEISGYIKRVVSPEDARAKAVSLVAKGRQSYEKALGGVQAADQEILSMVRANRRAGLIVLLSAIGGPDGEPDIEHGADVPKEASTPPKPTSKESKKSKSDKGGKASGSKPDKKKKKKKKKK